MRLTLLALSVATLAGGCASTPPEADPVQVKLNDLDARITRIERIVATQVEVAQHVDEVQGAVRQLRGRLEELEHGNEALAKQQRDLYADLDKRLAAAGGATAAGAAAGGAAAGSASGETAAAGGAATPGAAAGAAAGNPPSSVEQAVYTQAFVQIGVQIALLLRQRLVAVLELLEPAAQLAHVALHFIQVLGGLDLVRNDALDARDARIEIVQFQLHRVRLRRSAGAAGSERRHRQGKQGHAHGLFLLVLTAWARVAASDT